MCWRRSGTRNEQGNPLTTGLCCGRLLVPPEPPPPAVRVPKWNSNGLWSEHVAAAGVEQVEVDVLRVAYDTFLQRPAVVRINKESLRVEVGEGFDGPVALVSPGGRHRHGIGSL